MSERAHDLLEATADPTPDVPGGFGALARRTDAALARLARGTGSVDLALGETLLALFEGDRLVRLGYARREDYARERLGIPARTMYAWTRLAREMRTRPILRRAVALGLVSPTKALAVAKVADGDAEAAWTAAAMSMSLSDLVARVRATGGETSLDTFEVETLRLRMSAAQQDRLDLGIAAARGVLEADRPRWQCVEVVGMEWLGTFSAWAPEDGMAAAVETVPASEEEIRAAREAWLARWSERAGEIERRLDEVDSAVDLEIGPEVGPRELDARLRRVLEARRGFDEPFGRLAELVSRHRMWRQVGYLTFEEYCRDRLGMAARTVRERIWLERRMRLNPEIREALASGRLTFTKALLVAKDATVSDVAERIEAAGSTTWQETERESTAEEDRRDRAVGVRRLWGPKDAAETVALAIASAQAYAAARGETIDAGEALARMADHFVATWSAELKRTRRGISKARREVLARHGGLCAVPGCTRAADHDHHIEYRSRGGSDEPTNRVGVCAVHHLRGIHQGHVELSGRAGERLVWRLGAEDPVPIEVWETEGKGGAQRVG